LKIILINLKASTERLDFQRDQFRKLGLTYEVVKAVSNDDLSSKDLEELTFGWERPLRSVELACFMSHKEAWKTVFKSDEPALILEDDALLSKHIKELLASLKKKSYCDLVTLEVRGRKKIVAKKGNILSPNHMLIELYQDRTGAAGYVLWPSGAKKLLDKAAKSKPALADAFITSCYKLSAFQIEPASIIQLDQCDAYHVPCEHSTRSTISTQNKINLQDLNTASSLRYKYRRIYSQLRMGLRQLSTMRNSQKRYIKLEASEFMGSTNEFD